MLQPGHMLPARSPCPDGGTRLGPEPRQGQGLDPCEHLLLRPVKAGLN